MLAIAGGILVALIVIFVAYFILVNSDVVGAIFGILCAVVVVGWFVAQVF